LTAVSGSFLYFDEKSKKLTDLSTHKKMKELRKEGERNLEKMIKGKGDEGIKKFLINSKEFHSTKHSYK